MRVLLTGATGFVGRATGRELEARGHAVRRARRQAHGAARDGECIVGDIDGTTDWSSALGGIDAVVHLAARVHMLRDDAADPLAEYRRTNTAGTLRLARCAAAAGVRRFVFVSTIKVNGEETDREPFRASDPPRPTDPYAVSKHEAEVGLAALARETGMEVVVVRPPLVYGPGVKGNFASLVRWVRRRLPLPLGAVPNRRSLVGVSNLASLLGAAVEHPAAAPGGFAVYLVSDGEDLSTTELLRRIARPMGVTLRLLPVPVAALRLAGTLAGRGPAVRRLTGNLQVDASATRRALGWAPPATVDEELRRTTDGIS